MKPVNGHPPSVDGTVTVISAEKGAISFDQSDGLDAISDGSNAGRAPPDEVHGDLVLQAAATDVEASPPGLQKKGLRVSFPEFEVVSGYMDPPRPWNDASLCSTGELVASYLSACEKVGVKPNARLLSQLQVITNFDDRNETLTLKNESLDARHCETLEEVFRRVQFRTIDLEATKLEEEGAVTIFDMIEYYESCLKLNISYSKNLGQRGWQACSRMIRKTPCLENLEARGAVLSDFVMPILGRSLRVSSSLTSLHLEFTVMSGKPLQVLVASLKVNETLKELYLADNKLMPSDGIQLGGLLRCNRTLHLLDLRNNHLQDTGFMHICEGIWEQGKSNGLNTLVVWNNQLSYQAMNYLSKALLNSASLETINLGHNNLTNEGMHRLKESLLMNKTLLRIGLQAAKITCEGAIALAEFIAESVKLMRLDLRENEIKTGGLMALSLALKVSQSVTRIDLDKDPKKESGMKDYVEQQKRLLNDITTYMQRNRMLARKREEEEIALESQQLSDAKTDEQMESNPDEGKIGKETLTENESNAKEVGTPEGAVVAADDVKEVGFSGGEASPRHRMNLTLELKTRCETLESPDFVPESEMPPADLAPVDAGEALAPSSTRATKRKVVMDIPPSPMVSSQGKTVLVPIHAGPMSPSFDEDTSPGGETNPGDFTADSTFHSSPQGQPLSSSSESTSSADNSPGSCDQPVSSLSSLGSNSSIDINISPFPFVTANSYPSHLDNSLARTQNKKSSLKMTRPKHRFQVSKVNPSHKPTSRRGSGGSHKTLHMTTEHSKAESSSLMTSLAAFQSAMSFPLDKCNSAISKVSLGEVSLSGIISCSVNEKDSAKRTLNSLLSVENQNAVELSGLQKSSVEPHCVQNVPQYASSSSSPGEVTESVNSCGDEDGMIGISSKVGNSTEIAKFDSESTSNVTEIQSLLTSFKDKVIIGTASDEIIPEPKCATADNSGVSYQIENKATNAENTESLSCTASDNMASFLVQDGETDGSERNGVAENQERYIDIDVTGKLLHVSNGLALDFQEKMVDGVHKLYDGKTPSISSGNVI